MNANKLADGIADNAEVVKKLYDGLNEWAETVAGGLFPILEAITPVFQEMYDIFWKAYLEAGAPYGKDDDGMMLWYHEISRARRLRQEADRILAYHRMLVDFRKVINERQTTR
jgi:hypothetical protein